MFEPYSMETLILIGAGIGILIITTIIIACLVEPCCLCYKLIRKQKNKTVVASGITCGDGLYKNGYEMFTAESFGKQGGAQFASLSIKRDSCYSSMSDTSEGILSNVKFWNKSLYSTETEHLQLNEQVTPNESYGEVTLRLIYLTNENNNQVGKIFITVQEARSLQPRQYLSPTANAYIEVVAFPNKSAYTASLEDNQSQKHKKTFSFRTRTVRGNTSPYFDEKFLAAVDVKNPEMKNWYVKVTAYDDDKYGNPTELGNSDFPLKNALDKNCQEIIYKCSLKQPSKRLGDMLVCINHLPTAGRVVIHIVRVSNISQELEFATSVNLQVHVLLLSSMGRILKRRKSSFGHGEEGQLFEETIPFHVQSSQLASITCLLLVCAKAADAYRESSSSVSGDECHSIKATRDCVENGKGCKKLKELCIGKVILGATVRVPEGQSHWLAMMQRPRTAVSMWHKLR